MSKAKEFKKPEKYVPGPGDPALPPQLTEFQDKTTDEVMEELNRMPFFMTQLDNTDGEGGENLKLEALKALAYEGEPHEIAENFKNQGNDLYRARRYKDARELYNKGVEVHCDDDAINESLFLNRAACELELKNHRRCINDCKEALGYNPKNVKCFYRMGRAFFSLNKLEEAKEAIEFGLRFDSNNAALGALLDKIVKKDEEIKAYEAKKENEKKEKERLGAILQAAVVVRNISIVNTSQPPELVKDAKISLENEEDIESQLIFPTMVMYPTTDEFDFVGSVGELSTPQDLLELVMQRPEEWFQKPGHENFTTKKLIGYMETEAGGLIKVGKKVSFHDVLKMEKPNVPLFDNSLRIYFVPKQESEEWLGKWDKSQALERRK